MVYIMHFNAHVLPGYVQEPLKTKNGAYYFLEAYFKDTLYK